ncbi:MAG: regulatory protein merr, partial [Rhizobacter sp.]|nr:regulatory protein merr [Rhizobacter sp.]
CGVKPYVLRYWEQEFTQLKPMKRRGNRRYYQHHEVLLIRRIRELLYDQGFTISGARNRLIDSQTARKLEAEQLDSDGGAPDEASDESASSAEAAFEASNESAAVSASAAERGKPIQSSLPLDDDLLEPIGTGDPGTTTIRFTPSEVRAELRAIRELLTL